MRIALLFFFIENALAFSPQLIQEDLTARGKSLGDDRKSKSNIFHFQLKETDHGNLQIISDQYFAVFINNQLITRGETEIRWSVDSLKSVHVFPILISVYQRKYSKGFQAIITHSTTSEDHRYFSSYFRSTVSVVALALLAVFIFLIRTNGAVISEYFNFTKVFSLRFMDESAIIQKITSFNNIYVFGFCSGLIALNLILYDSNSTQTLSWSAWDILLRFSWLTIGIFIALLLKILTINFVSRLFKLNEFAPAQFFNFVKVLIGCFCSSSAWALIVFVLGGEAGDWEKSFYVFLLIFLGLYLVTTYMKLINKAGLTVFHLFSYLCLAEIFPMLLLLKIYYF